MTRIVPFALAALAAFAVHAQGGRLPLFDAHVHYNDDAVGMLAVDDVLATFRRAGVTAVLASSEPNDGTRALVVEAARAGAPRVVPFIRPYRHQADRATWFRDEGTLALIEEELRRPIDWRGIGEFHVDGSDAGSTVVRAIVALAVRRGLWLHAHCDEAALLHLLAHDARARIVWAHSGFTTPPARLAELLDRHPNLVAELSYRHDVTRDGRLVSEWRDVFVRHPRRFVIGSDTWTNGRWTQYAAIMDAYRGWLAQLPADVAAAIAHGNGARLFTGTP